MKISYSSIEEAWAEPQTIQKQKQQQQSNQQQQQQRHQQQQQSYQQQERGKFEQRRNINYDDMLNQTIEMNNKEQINLMYDSNEIKNCNNFVSHLESCLKCREKIQGIFMNYRMNKELIQPNTPSKYININKQMENEQINNEQNKQNGNIEEHFSSSRNRNRNRKGSYIESDENYELVITLLIGVFVIFVLDIINKVSKYIKQLS